MKSYDFRTKEQKWADFKFWVKSKWDAFVGFIRGNYDVLIIVVPLITAIVSGCCKVISRVIANHTANKNLSFKERSIYDRHLGKYTKLKRPLTTEECLEFERRKQNGEMVNTILDDMGLLEK